MSSYFYILEQHRTFRLPYGAVYSSDFGGDIPHFEGDLSPFYPTITLDKTFDSISNLSHTDPFERQSPAILSYYR